MKSFWIIALSLLLASCVPDRCNTPFGDGGSIDINMPEFAALTTVGGTLTINRGYKGIFIRRVSYSEFVAYDCACPHCHEVALHPMEGWGGEVLECPECESRYETLYGQPLDGSASGCPLYDYRTHFDGYTLTIY